MIRWVPRTRNRRAMMVVRAAMAILVRSAVALLVAFVALACAAFEPPTPPADDGPLLTVETRGGECPEGAACGSLIAISHDGRVRQIRPAAAELGVLTADTFTA